MLFKGVSYYTDLDALGDSILKIMSRTILIIYVLFELKKSKVTLKIFELSIWSLALIPLTIWSFISISGKASAIIDDATLMMSIFTLRCLTVALFEEIFFRSYLLHGIRTHFASSDLVAVHLTSFLFGFVHLGNLFFSSATIYEVLLQSFAAYGLALLFHIVLHKGHSLIIVIGIHFLLNFNGSYKSRLLDLESSTVDSPVDLGGFMIVLIFISAMALYSFRVFRANKLE